MTLACLQDPSTYNVDNYLTEVWDLSTYYLAARMPIAEIFGKSVTERADGLMSFTNGGEWRATRRSLQCGDIMCLGITPWMYTSAKHIGLFKESFVLPSWPAYGLARLADEKIRAAFHHGETRQ